MQYLNIKARAVRRHDLKRPVSRCSRAIWLAESTPFAKTRWDHKGKLIGIRVFCELGGVGGVGQKWYNSGGFGANVRVLKHLQAIALASANRLSHLPRFHRPTRLSNPLLVPFTQKEKRVVTQRQLVGHTMATKIAVGHDSSF